MAGNYDDVGVRRTLPLLINERIFTRKPELGPLVFFFLSMVFSIGVLSSFAAIGSLEEKVRLFAEGNRLYEQNKYEQAVQTFEKLISGGVHNPAVHYNLGNAYYKSGQLGKAIVQFEKAVRLDPGDQDIAENLAFIRARCVDKIEESTPVFWLSGLLRVHRFFSYRQKLWLLLLFWMAANSFFAWRFMRSGDNIRRITNWGLSITLLLLFCFTLSAVIQNRQENKQEAIVIVESSKLYSGPAETNSVLTIIHEGFKVEIRQQTEGWSQIVLPNGWNGWVSRGHLETL